MRPRMPCKNYQLAQIRDVHNVEIIREVNTAGEIGKNTEGDSDNSCGSCCESVNAICHVGTVTHCSDDEDYNQNIDDPYNYLQEKEVYLYSLIHCS